MRVLLRLELLHGNFLEDFAPALESSFVATASPGASSTLRLEFAGEPCACELGVEGACDDDAIVLLARILSIGATLAIVLAGVVLVLYSSLCFKCKYCHRRPTSRTTPVREPAKTMRAGNQFV